MAIPEQSLEEQFALLDAFMAETAEPPHPGVSAHLALDPAAEPTERILSALTIARTQVDALMAVPTGEPDIAELTARLDDLERTLGEVFAQLAELRESLPAPANPQ